MAVVVSPAWAADGDLDVTFDGDGVAIHGNAAGGNGVEFGWSVATQSDGKIVVVGFSMNASGNSDLAVWRFNTDGTLDTTFDTNGFLTHHNAAGGNSNDCGNGVAIQSDGKIIAVGYSQNAAGNYDLAVWRFNANGTLDTTFDGDGIFIHNNAAGGNGPDCGQGVVIQSDGKIVVGGKSTDVSGYEDLAVWRFNVNGTLDTTFDGDGIRIHNSNAGWLGHDGGYGVALQSDGKIVVVGCSPDLSNDNLEVWRFNTDGSFDTTFDTDGFLTHHNAAGGNSRDFGNGVAIQSDGKIVAVGFSQNAAGNLDLAVWRFNVNGTLDTTFDGDGIRIHNSAAGGNGEDLGWGIAIQSDGKIVTAGRSLNAAGNLDLAVWRFNPDGTFDTTFDTNGFLTHHNAAGGNSADDGYGVAIQSDGKIVVAGLSVNATGNSDLAVWRFLGTSGDIDSIPPSPFSLLTPAHGTETNSATVTFSWTASVDSNTPVSYRLQIANDSAFSSLAFDSSGLSATSLAITLAGNAWYTWRVIASDTWGNTRASSETWVLAIDTSPPSMPTAIAPRGETTASANVLFSWSAASDSALANLPLALSSPLIRYRIEVSRETSFATLVASDTTSDTSRYLILPFSDTSADIFFWRACAVDTVGNISAWSGPDSVRRLAPADTVPPASYSLLTPAHGTETNSVTVTISWTASVDSNTPVSYRLQIANDSAFSSLAFETSGLSATSLAVTLSGNAWYTWRVIASDSSGNTRASSETWILAVDTSPPSMPTAIAPRGETTASANVLFSWSASSDSALANLPLALSSPLIRYRIEVSRETSFATLVASDTTSDTSRYLLLPFSDTSADTFIWRVRAVDTVGNLSAWSGPDSVRRLAPADTVPPSSYSLLTPAHGTETNSATVTFSWTASVDSNTPVSYRLQVSNNSAFSFLAFETSGLSATSLAVALPGNKWYAWRIVASDTWGNTRASAETWVLAIDTSPPSMPTAIAPRGETTASANVLFAWSASSDSALANLPLALSSPLIRYRIEVSRETSFATLVASDTTSDTSRYLLLPFSDTSADTFIWRVRAVDTVGNLSGWSGPDSVRRLAPADTVPPLPPLRLAGVALETGAALLTWDPSPSAEMTGGGYRLYWNAGAETMPTTYLDWIPHAGADQHRYVTAILTGDRRYRFRLQAVDASGNQETGSNSVEVTIPATASTTALTEIITPHSGHRVNRATGGTQVVARIIGTDAQRASVTSVLMQYRLEGGAWTDMTPISGQSNPVSWGGTGNVGMHWANSAVPLGDVDLRVVPILTGGARSETTAGVISVRLVASGANADISTELGIGADTTKVTQSVNRNSRDTVTAMTPGGAEIGVFLDSGVAPAAPDTAPAQLVVGVSAFAPVETATLERTMTGVGVFTELRFGDTSQPSGAVRVTAPVPGVDGNGNLLVRGRRVAATALEAWGWSADTGRWERIGGVSFDATTGRASFAVGHFSFFTLAAPVAAATSLGGFTVYPNPWVPGDGNPITGVEYTGAINTGITFENLPQGSDLKIYTPLGELVAKWTIDASGGAQWDVKNMRGERAASGIYVYVVQTPQGERRVGKFAVVR